MARHVSVTPEAHELYRAGDRRLETLFKPAGRAADLRAFPFLADAVSRIRPSVWQEDPTQALWLVMELAINKLPESRPDNCDITWRHIAWTIYSIRTELPLRENGEPHTYNSLCDLAYEESGKHRSRDTFDRNVAKMREMLVAILRGMEQAAIARAEQASDVGHADIEQQTYISRPDYEQWLIDRHQQGVRLLVLHGDAGTGKTTLAGRFCESLGSSGRRAKISCSDHDRLEETLEVFLQANDVAPENINPGNKRALFASLVTGPEHPPVVVLDDVPDYAIIDFVPDESLSTILVTSMLAPYGRYGQCAREVDDLDHDQACALVQRRCPAIDQKEAELLAETLGHRVLALSDACGLLATTDVTPRQLIDRLNSDLATGLDNIGDPRDRHRRRLTTVYRLMLEQLQDAPTTLDMLDIFLFAPRMTKDHLAIMLSRHTVLNENPMRPVATARFTERIDHPTGTDHDSPPPFPFEAEYRWYWQKGARVFKYFTSLEPSDAARHDVEIAGRQLRALNLLRPSEKGFTMHALTGRLLYQLRDSRRLPMQRGIWIIAFQLLSREAWGAGQALRTELCQWLEHAHDALHELKPADFEGILERTTFINGGVLLMGALLQAQRQYGFKDYLASVRRAAAFGIESREYLTNEVELSSSQEDAFVYYSAPLISGMTDAIILTTYPSDARPEEFQFNRMPGERFSTEQRRYFWFDTEWDPVHHVVYPPELTEAATQEAEYVAGHSSDITYDRLRAAAESALWAGSYFYQQAQWAQAVEAFEQACEWYAMVGGDTECVSGYLNAAWRLTRAYTRRGDLEAAQASLNRAYAFSRERNNVWANDINRFRSYDRLLQYRLRQQRFEIDFTTWVTQEYEDDPLSDTQKRKAVVEDAAAMGRVIDDLSAERLAPEWILYVFRLSMVAPELVQSRWDISALVEKVMNSGGELQRVLACTQTRGMGMVSAALDLLHGPEPELPKEQRRRMEEGWRTFGEHMSSHLNQLEAFGAPYWHARALAGLTVFGIIDEKPQQWLSPIREQFCEAATRIDRSDWITMVEEIEGGTRSPLWLLGYLYGTTSGRLDLHAPTAHHEQSTLQLVARKEA